MSTLIITKDPRLPTNTLDLHTEETARQITYRRWAATNPTNIAGATWAIPIPAGSGISRRLRLRLQGTVSFGNAGITQAIRATNDVGGAQVEGVVAAGLHWTAAAAIPGTQVTAQSNNPCDLNWAFGLVQSPIAAATTSLNIDLGSGNSSITTSNINMTSPAMRYYNMSKEESCSTSSLTANDFSYTNQYFDWQDANGPFTGSTKVDKTFGYSDCSKISSIRIASAGGQNNRYIQNVAISFDICESLECGVFSAGLDERMAIYGISTLGVSINYISDIAKSIIKRVFVPPTGWRGGPATDEYVAPWLTQLIASSSISFSQQDLLVGYIMAEKIPRVINYGMTVLNYFNSQTQSSGRIAFPMTTDSLKDLPTQSILSPLISTNVVPRGILVWITTNSNSSSAARDQNGSAPTQFLPIFSLQVNFNNQSGLLSSYTKEELYDMSVKNGLRIPYDSFAGNCAVSQDKVSSATQDIPNAVGVAKYVNNSCPIYITMEDLGLPEGIYAGSVYPCNITIQAGYQDNVVNTLRQTAAGPPPVFEYDLGGSVVNMQVCLVTDQILQFDSGTFTPISDIKSIVSKTVHSSSKPLRERLMGGSLSDIFDGVGNLFSGNFSGALKNLPGALETGASFLGLGPERAPSHQVYEDSSKDGRVGMGAVKKSAAKKSMSLFK